MTGREEAHKPEKPSLTWIVSTAGGQAAGRQADQQHCYKNGTQTQPST